MLQPFEDKLTAAAFHPVAHRPQADPSPAMGCSFGDAYSIVFDAKPDPVASFGNRDSHRSRTGMTIDVRKRLLRDPEEREGRRPCAGIRLT